MKKPVKVIRVYSKKNTTTQRYIDLLLGDFKRFSAIEPVESIRIKTGNEALLVSAGGYIFDVSSCPSFYRYAKRRGK